MIPTPQKKRQEVTRSVVEFCIMCDSLRAVSNGTKSKSSHAFAESFSYFYCAGGAVFLTKYCTACAHQHRIHFPPQLCMKSLLLYFSSY